MARGKLQVSVIVSDLSSGSVYSSVAVCQLVRQAPALDADAGARTGHEGALAQ